MGFEPTCYQITLSTAYQTEEIQVSATSQSRTDDLFIFNETLLPTELPQQRHRRLKLSQHRRFWRPMFYQLNYSCIGCQKRDRTFIFRLTVERSTIKLSDIYNHFLRHRGIQPLFRLVAKPSTYTFRIPICLCQLLLKITTPASPSLGFVIKIIGNKINILSVATSAMPTAPELFLLKHFVQNLCRIKCHHTISLVPI